MGKLCDLNGYIQFSDSDMNFETEDYEHYEKCGEIYFSESGRFELYCNLCDERFIDYNIFFGTKHLEQHFTFFDNSSIEIVKPNEEKNTVKIESNIQEESNENKFKIEISDFKKDDEAVDIMIKDISPTNSNNPSVANLLCEDTKNVPYKISKLICYVCSEKFLKSSSRDQHVLECHREQYKGKYYSCLICKNDFLLKSQYEQHVRKHTGGKPFACGSCKKSFISLYNLNVHNSRYHQDTKPYICRVEECSAGYKSWISRLNHERSHSKKDKLPFRCKECDMKFTNAGEMTKHFRNTHMDKAKLPYQCNICNRSFHQKRLLTYHIFTHTGEKPFICKVCNAKFAKPSILSQHKLLHSGTKRYVCTVCDERFFQSAGLSAHKRRKNHFQEEEEEQ